MSTIPPDEIWAKDSAGNVTDIADASACVGFQKSCPKLPALPMTSAVMNGMVQWLQKWACSFIERQTCKSPIATAAELNQICESGGHLIGCMPDGSPRRVDPAKFAPQFNKDTDGNIVSVTIDGVVCPIGGTVSLSCGVGVPAVGSEGSTSSLANGGQTITLVMHSPYTAAAPFSEGGWNPFPSPGTAGTWEAYAVEVGDAGVDGEKSIIRFRKTDC